MEQKMFFLLLTLLTLLVALPLLISAMIVNLSCCRNRSFRLSSQGVGVVVLIFFIAGLVSVTRDWIKAPTLPEGFALQRFHTIDGRALSIAELSAKKPLLIYLWTHGCSVCNYTTTAMLQLSDNNYNVLAVALHSGSDIRLVRLLHGKHLVLPVINDPDGQRVKSWKINTLPTFLIISRGRIVQSTSGWTSTLSLRMRLWWVDKWYR